ncbi:MAG: polyphosphate kinase 2 [Saprospiraceae bacterium]|nr:polyphosphate kinase 2 [Saprospiraceae bacterium]
MAYTKSDLKKLSSTRGLIYLLATDPPEPDAVLKKLKYDSKLKKLQIELVKLQNWVVDQNERVLIIFEGGEFSGKGLTIKAFTEHLNPRSIRVVALPKPNETEAGQWYFQRYIMRLPRPGEMVFFDRSWYNRAMVEPVNGFCTSREYDQFMSEVNHFERMIHNDGIIIVKLFLSITKSVQAERIQMVRKNPLRRWELTKVDLNAQKLWDKYQSYEQAIFKQTSTRKVPWKVIDANDPYLAHIAAIRHVLNLIPYKNNKE